MSMLRKSLVVLAALSLGIAAEEADLEAELEDYPIVPVISLGVSYRF